MHTMTPKKENDQFIRNALDYANRVHGKEIFHQDEWDRHGEWNDMAGRHEQYLTPRRDIWFEGCRLHAGEKVFVISSHKYDSRERQQLWDGAGLSELKGWQMPKQKYGELYPFAQILESGTDLAAGLYVLSTQLAN